MKTNNKQLTAQCTCIVSWVLMLFCLLLVTLLAGCNSGAYQGAWLNENTQEVLILQGNRFAREVEESGDHYFLLGEIKEKDGIITMHTLKMKREDGTFKEKYVKCKDHRWDGSFRYKTKSINGENILLLEDAYDQNVYIDGSNADYSIGENYYVLRWLQSDLHKELEDLEAKSNLEASQPKAKSQHSNLRPFLLNITDRCFLEFNKVKSNILIFFLDLFSPKSNSTPTKVWTGMGNSFFADDQGQLWGCGATTYHSSLTNITHIFTSVLKPRRILFVKNIKSISIDTSDDCLDPDNYRCLVLQHDGTVWLWNLNVESNASIERIESLKDIKEISRYFFYDDNTFQNNYINLVIKSDGTVWQFSDERRKKVHQVSGLTRIKSVSAGKINLALKNDGTVWEWTKNKIPVENKHLKKIIQISQGKDYCMALDSTGAVWAWGRNTHKQLGIGSNPKYPIPLKVQGLPAITSISCKSHNNIALAEDGTVWEWGYREPYYEIDDIPDYKIEAKQVPVKVSNLSNIQNISADADHAVAIDKIGNLYTWGYNNYGQLGNGTLIGPKYQSYGVGNGTLVDSKNPILIKENKAAFKITNKLSPDEIMVQIHNSPNRLREIWQSLGIFYEYPNLIAGIEAKKKENMDQFVNEIQGNINGYLTKIIKIEGFDGYQYLVFINKNNRWNFCGNIDIGDTPSFDELQIEKVGEGKELIYLNIYESGGTGVSGVNRAYYYSISKGKIIKVFPVTYENEEEVNIIVENSGIVNGKYVIEVNEWDQEDEDRTGEKRYFYWDTQSLKFKNIK